MEPADWSDWKPRLNAGLKRLFSRENLERASFEGILSDQSGWEHQRPIEAGIPYHLIGNSGDGWHFSLKTLRRFPRWVTAMTLMTNMKRVSEDHREYWRTTGAFASEWMYELHRQKTVVKEETEEGTVMEMAEEPKPPFPFGIDMTTSLDRNILHDLCLLIQIAELKQFQYPLFKRSHPVLSQLAHNSYLLASTYGFAVLEGLLRRRCLHVNTDGTLSDEYDEPILSFLKNDIMAGSRRVHILEGFRLLEAVYGGLSTQKTLVEIDRLNRLDVNEDSDPIDIINMMDELVDEEELNDPEGPLIGDHSDGDLLAKLKNQRNKNHHRENLAKASAAIVVTLCCLIFWDSLTKPQFEYLRWQIPSAIERRKNMPEIANTFEFGPGTFYRFIRM